MIKIAEVFGPENVALWRLVAQCGVRHVVGGISLRPRPGAGPEGQPWSFQSLLHTKTAYKNAGFEFAVIESRPPMDKIKLGLPGRDEQLEVIKQLIRNMGALEIPVYCPNWMPILGVIRTSSTAVYGIHRPGTAYRMDEVPIPLRSVLDSPLPADLADVVDALG